MSVDPRPDLPADDEESQGPFWLDRQWWKGARRLTFFSWLASILALVTGVALARLLGVTGYGDVVLATSIAGFVGMLLDLTLEEAVAFHGSRCLAAGHPSRVRQLLNTAFVVDAALGLLIAGGVIIGAGPLSRLVVGTGELAPLIAAAALVTLASTVNGTSAAALFIVKRPDLLVRAQLTAAALRLVLAIIGAWVWGPLGAVLAMALAQFLASGFQTYLAWTHMWSRLERDGARFSFRSWLTNLATFGLRSSLSTTIASLTASLVPVALGRLSGSREVGIFAVARLPVTLASVTTAPFRQLLLPEQLSLSASGDRRTLQSMIRTYTRWSLAIGLPAMAAGWFVLPYLIEALYSDRFLPAVPAARILLLPALLFVVFGWAKSLPAAMGRPGIRTTFLLGGAIATFGVLFAMGDGAQGAALALAAGHVLVSVGWIWLAIRLPLNEPGGRLSWQGK